MTHGTKTKVVWFQMGGSRLFNFKLSWHGFFGKLFKRKNSQMMMNSIFFLDSPNSNPLSWFIISSMEDRKVDLINKRPRIMNKKTKQSDVRNILPSIIIEQAHCYGRNDEIIVCEMLSPKSINFTYAKGTSWIDGVTSNIQIMQKKKLSRKTLWKIILLQAQHFMFVIEDGDQRRSKR